MPPAVSRRPNDYFSRCGDGDGTFDVPKPRCPPDASRAEPEHWPCRGAAPTEEFLRRLAEQLGLRTHDLFLVAGRPLPEDAWAFDGTVSGELPQLVRQTLLLSPSDRRQLRHYARSLTVAPQTVFPGEQRPYEQYPPGFGSLLVRMLALRNLGWSSAARVMYLMSGVYLSAATIEVVGRGDKALDAELLDGFAAVLGVPVGVLASLTGVRLPEERPGPSPATVDTAALLWEVRQLTKAQVQQVLDLARASG